MAAVTPGTSLTLPAADPGFLEGGGGGGGGGGLITIFIKKKVMCVSTLGVTMYT